MQFTAYDDKSTGFRLIDSESSLFFAGQEFVVKQCVPDFNAQVDTVQITASHVQNEVNRIWQRDIRSGTVTYSVQDILAFFFDGNELGFSYEVIGDFETQAIDDLGNCSAKDGLSKITDTWPTATIMGDGRKVKVYSADAWAQNLGNRIDYLHNTTEIQLTYDSNDLVNQVWVIGATVETDDSSDDSTTDDTEHYYFEPHLVTDEDSVARWGIRPGDDIEDDRFTNSDSMDAYAKSQMILDPSLTFDVTLKVNEKPVPGEIRRLEIRKNNFVTNIQVVAFTWYPMDATQATSITLNNTAKTILDYQNSNKKNLDEVIKSNKTNAQKIVEARKAADKAYSSRICGDEIVDDTVTRSGDVDLKTDGLPGYRLKVAADNNEFGLKAGDEFLPVTRADLVDGLDDLVAGVIPKAATDSSSGLLSAADKTKLDKLSVEPLAGIELKDTVTGSIYMLTVANGQVAVKGVGE